MLKKMITVLFLMLLLAGCTAFAQTLSLPENCETVASGAFTGCTSVTAVSIPGTVRTIENDAFLDCGQLQDVYYMGTHLEWSSVAIGSGNGSLLNAHIHFHEPHLFLSYIPPYGNGHNIEGYIAMDDGTELDASKWRISLFLQLYEGGTYYVKPYSAQPYVMPAADGTFSARYNTGGSDYNAKILHMMIVPAAYTPESYYATYLAALDTLHIDRSENGTIAVSPADRRIYHNKPLRVSVSDSMIAVDVGFYVDGSYSGSALSASQIRKQLTAIKPFSDTVRFYGSAGELYKAYAIAKEMGFSVIGTAWLGKNEQENKKELNALIEHCNNGLCCAACVGNELLLNNTIPEWDLIRYIEYVRERIPSNIPVTTSDSISDLQDHPSVLTYCDFLFMNAYPFWGGTVIDDALADFIAAYASLHSCDPAKQLVVSETGWPTAGETSRNAVPNEKNAAVYFHRVRTWAVENNVVVFFFEGMDEPWKSSAEGEAGAHWGILDGSYKIKSWYAKLDFFK